MSPSEASAVPIMASRPRVPTLIAVNTRPTAARPAGIQKSAPYSGDARSPWVACHRLFQPLPLLLYMVSTVTETMNSRPPAAASSWPARRTPDACRREPGPGALAARPSPATAAVGPEVPITGCGAEVAGRGLAGRGAAGSGVPDASIAVSCRVPETAGGGGDGL